VKGIILAGGNGTRLYPVTVAVSKQLLPVYDKPMIYYPLSTLVLAGIREILVITTPRDVEAFRALLGDGRQWGIALDYAVQPRPEGLAQAFIIGSPFIAGSASALILGDNLFYGQGLPERLRSAAHRRAGATIFCYQVADPERYGVASLSPSGQVMALEEKPKRPASRWAVTGLYYLDGRAAEFAAELRPSRRGEFEIVDLLKRYLEIDALHAQQLGRGFAWLDTGTHESLIEAGEFVRAIERRQGQKIACVEEAAYRAGFIDAEQVLALAGGGDDGYRRYLRELVTAGDSGKWLAERA
jgi:glucose-1-phosphate thymidylyltransferase